MKKGGVRTTSDPSNSVYAFVAYVASYVLLICYLGWAFLPARVLHSLGITYYPSRYFAVAIPAYFLTAYVLLGLAYMGYNMMNTPDPTDLVTVRDTFPSVPPASAKYVKCGVKEGIPNYGDIDPVDLCRVMK